MAKKSFYFRNEYQCTDSEYLVVGFSEKTFESGILERDFSDIYFEKRARPDHIYARFIFKILKGDDYEKNIFMDCLGHVPLSGV